MADYAAWGLLAYGVSCLFFGAFQYSLFKFDEDDGVGAAILGIAWPAVFALLAVIAIIWAICWVGSSFGRAIKEIIS